MPGAHVSFAGNLTDDPELRHTDGGIALANAFEDFQTPRREPHARSTSASATRIDRRPDPHLAPASPG
jgi:single-stranded DNA-binding protein